MQRAVRSSSRRGEQRAANSSSIRVEDSTYSRHGNRKRKRVPKESMDSPEHLRPQKFSAMQSAFPVETGESSEEDDQKQGQSGWNVFTNWLGGWTAIFTKNTEGSEERIQRAKRITSFVMKNFPEAANPKSKFLRNNLTELKKIFFQLDDLSTEKALESRKEIGKELVESRLVDLLCHVVQEYLKIDGDPYDFESFNLALLLLFNFSDSTPEISVSAAASSELFKRIAAELRIYYNKLENGLGLSKLDEEITRNLLGFTNNCSSVSESRKKQKEENYTAVLLPYLKAKNEDYKMSAILTLANIVNEEESALLNTGVDAVKYLLETLATALQNRRRRYRGWSAKELAHGVARLAVNDFNKVILVAKGVLPLLLKLSFVDNEEERREAVGALWALSFDDKNKDLMLGEPGLLDRIKELRESPYSSVNTAAQGMLWNLRNRLNTPKENGTSSTAERNETKPPNSVGVQGGGGEQQVMISYQWDSQPIILKIRDHLKSRGINTWVDVDRMKGSTLGAMADAVEGSSVVLMCVSQRYKDSLNCRAEAEYAYQRRVPVIPLVMEGGYKADGWLGILLGTKLYFDFSGKHKFETKLEEMLKELESTLQQKQPFKKAVDVVDVGHAPKRHEDVTSKDISQWKKKRVTEWMRKYRLTKPSLTSLTGKHLVFLMNLRKEAPERFYSLLESNLGLTSMDDLMDFVEALNDLQ